MTRALMLLLTALFAALTVAGQTPYLVRDINTTTRDWIYGSSPAYFTADGETTYFFATTHTGRDLWKHAGGAASLVRQFVPNTTFTQSYPHSLTRLGSGVVVFVADDGVHKRELWRTDGTEAGTVMVRDIHPGAGDANVTILGVWNGRVYFSADDGVNGEELWTSDGTEAGTALLKNFDGTSASSGPMSIAGFPGDRLLVATRSDLWITDGTEAGTTLVKASISPVAPVIAGSRAYFQGRDSTAGRELWVTDGTENGTTRVIDLAPGEADGMTSAPVVLGATAILFIRRPRAR
jgi:ELWxxDGT repeat protein